MASPCPQKTESAKPARRWREIALILLAMAAAAILGFANLDKPSLWHDEAFHVLVGKSIAQTGQFRLPSSNPTATAMLYHALLGGVIALFGDSEFAVRTPSVLFAVLNVLLTYLLLRPLLGRAPALIAAWGLALSPWSVAWSREARFYTLQQTACIATLGLAWITLNARTRSRAILAALIALTAYLTGLFASLHSLLILAPLGAYTAMGLLPVGNAILHTKRQALSATIFIAATGLATLLAFALFLPQSDSLVIFKEAGAASGLRAILKAGPLYYPRWLWENLSLGFFLLALLGFVAMIRREKRKGLYVTLAFCAPVIMLTFGMTYRMPRFMFFIYPCYIAAWAYGLVELIRFLAAARQSWPRLALTPIVLLFLARLAFSAILLTQNTLHTASGADITLANRHPQWRKPCQYVRERLTPDTTVITTTFLPTLYYIGRVDEWFPSRCLPWEYWESGSNGLKDPHALEAYLQRHPKGYFLAESWRFNDTVFPELHPDRLWVESHMTPVPEGASDDVALYAWGMP